uniref:Uncharacterized protein n=1 Tax=Romanomermis culicivorax TaxID=13658 RepID=A0A915HER2_ROMCU
MGFMLAILCSIANSRPANSPFSRRHLGVDVEDILISVLGINDGFKSLTITKERMSGMKVVLIQNFFFKRKLSELHDRGLSKKERENVIPGLIKEQSTLVKKPDKRIMKTILSMVMERELDTNTLELIFEYVADQVKLITSFETNFHIRLGVTLDPDNFTYSDCFTWNKTLVDCPKPVHTPRSLATSKVLPTSYETYFTIVEKFKQINEAKMHSSDPLHIERNGHLQMSNFFQRYTLQVDTLKNPYYSTSDLIWMGILVHDTSLANYKQLNSILKWKSSSMVKSGSSSTLKQKLSPFKAADGFLVPLLGAGLAIYDIRAAVQNYQNGDHSSMAVYNIASSFVFLATSLMSLGASIVMLANGLSAVSPIFSAAVFIVGTAFYIIGHVWKGRLEIERISDRISMSEWEKVRQYTRIILGRGIYNEFIQASNDKEWNKQRLKDDIKYMEKNTGIRNFVTSAGCYDVDQTEFGPFELDNSTLLITNMASDMMQMFILKEEDVPLLTIIIEHYKSEQMKNTKLKFEHGIELDLNNLNGHEIINYFTFKLKIHVMCKHIGEEGLVLRQDLRFNSDG